MFAKLPKFVKVFILLYLLLVISLAFTTLGEKDNDFEGFFVGSKNRIGGLIDKELVSQNTKDQIATLGSDWAVVVKDLKTQKKYYFNENKPITSASLYKLAVMYAAYDGMEKGTIKPNDVIAKERNELEKFLSDDSQKPIETPSPEPEEKEIISYTVKSAITPMITISDNYSALLLAEKIGWASIDELMLNEGINGVDLQNNSIPTITARATADILERIYKGQAVSKVASEEMEALLLAQKFNTRIPRLLPKDVEVAHKTGELGTIRHDAGIVYGKKSDYIFVFLSDTKNPLEAEDTIANLSKTIFATLETN